MDVKTKTALWLEALFGALLIFAVVLTGFFASVESLNNVLSKSDSYGRIAQVAQTKINDIAPTEVKNDPIAYGIIGWGVNRFITADLVEKLAVPTLRTVVKLAQTPTTIQGDAIFLDTTGYKAKLTDDVNSFNIPQGLKNLGGKFVAAVPANLQIVDLQKRPNSLLAKIIRARDRLHQLRDLTLYLAIAVLAGLILIGFWSRQTINNILRSLSLTVVAIGGATLVATAILALVAKYNPIYPGTEIIDGQINGLFVGLTNYYLKVVAEYGVTVLVVGIVAFIPTVAAVQNWTKDSLVWTKKLLTPPKA